MYDYIIIEETSCHELAREVNKYLSRGFVLNGGLVIQPIDHMGDIKYLQAVVYISEE